MAKLSTRIKSRLIVPLTLLGLVVLEEVVAYELRRVVADVFLRTGAIVACYGVGFAIVGNRLAPYVQRALVKGHRATRREGGVLGTLLFFLVMYALVFLLFFVMETRGVQALLPSSLR